LRGAGTGGARIRLPHLFPSGRRTLRHDDAMHSGFGETELSGNDAYTATLPMKLSNFLAIDNHSRTTKHFAFLLHPSSPAVTRSRMILRSSSATAPSTVNTIFPHGCRLRCDPTWKKDCHHTAMGLSAGRDLPPTSAPLTFGNTRRLEYGAMLRRGVLKTLKDASREVESIDAWSEPITDRQGQCGVG
jgi:hypothetical protein